MIGWMLQYRGVSVAPIRRNNRSVSPQGRGTNNVRVSFYTYVMLGLALLGVADAFYDSYAIYTHQPLWCPPPIDGCNIVAASSYAYIRGVPVGYFGVAYYLCMFALAALLVFAPTSRALRLAAVSVAAVGVIFSVYFMRVQFAFIHAFCIYCLISAVLTVLLLIAALAHYRASRSPIEVAT